MSTRGYLQWLDRQSAWIWSSSPFIPEVRQREQWFAEMAKEKLDTREMTFLDFHRNAGDGDPWNDVVMNRGGIVAP